MTLTVRLTRRRALVAAAVLALGAAAVAYAVWTVNSDGQGAARTGSLVAPTLTAPTEAQMTGTTCTPGNTCTVEFLVTNPNGPLVLTAIQPNPATDGPDPRPTCSNGTLTIENVGGLSIPIPNGATQITVPNGARLAANAPTDCQNARYVKGARGSFSTP
jgi:hypothetical protein